MMKRKIVLIVLLALAALGAGSYFLFKKTKENNQNKINSETNLSSQSQCLNNNETADYKIEKQGEWKGIIKIYILDKENPQKKKEIFQTDTLSFNHYHPIEIHKCSMYVIRASSYDYEKDKLLPGGSIELWKYKYNGQGRNIILFSKKDELGNFKSEFSYDFRVDPTETYVALEKGYLGKDEYATVIKNLETKEDALVLRLKDILAKEPDLEGNFGMNQWTKDGRYYWGNIFDGANVLTFFRVEKDTWKTDILPAPKGAMGGDLLNPENGWITYDDGAPWTGDADFDQMYREQWKKEGKKVHFYLYNLFTKKQILLGSGEDPTSSFEAKWLSDNELEYALPGGQKKIFKTE